MSGSQKANKSKVQEHIDNHLSEAERKSCEITQTAVRCIIMLAGPTVGAAAISIIASELLSIMEEESDKITESN